MNDVEIVQKIIGMLTELLAHEAHEGEGSPEQLGITGNGVKKAEVVAPFQSFEVVKSWRDGSTLFREGWVSTNHIDREKDITEPEAFSDVLDGYFALGAPVSSTHNTESYPVGHLQKGALVRDGKIFKSATHPTDPGEFTAFPGSGTGFYGRHAITEASAAEQVEKGNVGGCSFIATVQSHEPLPGGGRRFLRFGELVETTIAAYPINRRAVLSIAKSYGILPEEKETPEMTPEQMQELIQKAVTEALTTQVQKAEAPAQQVDMTPVVEAVTDLKKAFMDTQFNREGVGRVGTVETQNPFEVDPIAHVTKKAAQGEELTSAEKDFVSSMTLAAIFDGMRQ